MSLTVELPLEDGSTVAYQLAGLSPYPTVAEPATSRLVYAAVHVVAELAESAHEIDWEATLEFRRHVWRLGLGVAEAMDTAQRGMGLDWKGARCLIELTCAEAGGPVVAGAQTDQLDPGVADSLTSVTEAYLEQCEAIEKAGATVAVMASRDLCRVAQTPEDYIQVYDDVLSRLDRPAIIHWLGDAFDPALTGYWGSLDYEGARATCLAILELHRSRVIGVKLSLLDQEKEIDLRERLPPGVRMFTGDDFNYPSLISSGSDALLGAFDYAAPAAAWALQALDRGDRAEFERRLEPTVPLSRHVFSHPTSNYKTGVVFLAYLNDFQSHFRMVGGLESGRSVTHLATVFRLADEAGLLRDPELAAHRMRLVLSQAQV